VCVYSLLNAPSNHRKLKSYPTRRSSDLREGVRPPKVTWGADADADVRLVEATVDADRWSTTARYALPSGREVTATIPAPGLHLRSEEHTSELQSRENLVCRLLLEKKKKK